MSRYFYILSLLISIDWIFCYDYISKDPHYKRIYRHKQIGNRVPDKFKVNKDVTRDEPRPYYDVVDSKDTVAEIDVASFMQDADSGSANDDEAYIYQRQKSNRSPKDYNDYGHLTGKNNENLIKREKSNDFLHPHPTPDLNVDQHLLKDATNPRRYSFNALSLEDLKTNRNIKSNEKLSNYDELLELKTSNHNPEKKCSLKRMDIPFFSHNKSKTSKPKKHKKRKLFRFNSHDKDKAADRLFKVNGDTNSNKVYSGSEKPYNLYKIRKRSYEEQLCPECKKKFIASYKRNRKVPIEADVHSKVSKNTDNNDLWLDNDNTKRIFSGRRRKRHDFSLDKERQMKELEEVQRKIDSVEINIPNYERV